MMDTYAFGCELDWDWASFYICQPLKGRKCSPLAVDGRRPVRGGELRQDPQPRSGGSW